MDRGAWRATVNGVAKELDTTERLTLVLISPVLSPFLKNNFIYLFIFGCAGSLLLRGLFSGCSERGLLSSTA